MNNHGSCPEIPPKVIYLSGFPRAALRTKERQFGFQGLDPNHLIVSDPTPFPLRPAFPLLTFSPMNRRLFTRSDSWSLPC